MKKIAIIVANEMNDYEIFVPTFLWRKAGLTVHLVSVEKKNSVVLETGSKISCFATLDKVNLSQYHALYIPGGAGVERLKHENWPSKNQEQMNKFINHLLKFRTEDKKFLLTTDSGAEILHYLNLLQDARIAGMDEDFQPTDSHEELLISGNLISVKGLLSLNDFAIQVIESLEGNQKQSEKISRLIYGD